MRINAYLVRWIRQKCQRLAAERKAIAKMQESDQRYPRMFARWRPTASAVMVCWSERQELYRRGLLRTEVLGGELGEIPLGYSAEQ